MTERLSLYIRFESKGKYSIFHLLKWSHYKTGGSSTVLGTQDNMTTYRYNGYKHTSLETIPIYLLYNISTTCAIYM